MCPEHANVAVIEDDPDNQRRIAERLTKSGHQVVATAVDLQEAIDLSNHLEVLGVHVAIVDGNLKPGDYSGSDGTRVVQEIREKSPSVKILAFTSSDVTGADVLLDKTLSGYDRLAPIVTAF
jgi:CheY-like chemotaxis protein